MNLAKTSLSGGVARSTFPFLSTTLPPFTRGRVMVLNWLLRLATAGAFIGHGGYGAIVDKPVLYRHYSQLGPSVDTLRDYSLVAAAGWFEIALGLIVLLWPIRALLLVMAAYKIGEEFLFPLSGMAAWEFVERWSSYTAPIALLVVRGWPRTLRAWFR